MIKFAICIAAIIAYSAPVSAETLIYPTRPYTSIRDYNSPIPAYIVEEDIDGDLRAYPTRPYTSIRDYGSDYPSFVIEQDGRSVWDLDD